MWFAGNGSSRHFRDPATPVDRYLLRPISRIEATLEKHIPGVKGRNLREDRSKDVLLEGGFAEYSESDVVSLCVLLDRLLLR